MVTSLALGKSYDIPNTIKVTPKTTQVKKILAAT